MNNEYGARISATATGSTGAYASIAGAAGKTIYITDIGVSSDLVTGAVYAIVDGATVIWKGIISGLGPPVERSFITPLRITEGATATVQISGTAQSYASLSGFTTTK